MTRQPRPQASRSPTRSPPGRASRPARAAAASSRSRVGRREIGHLHGDRSAHFSFPKDVWGELYEQGRIDYHPVFPGQARARRARRIENDADVVT